MAQYGKKAEDKVKKTMHERKHRTLKSGSGKKVTSRKQAIAIGLSEARKSGAKVPKKRKRRLAGVRWCAAPPATRKPSAASLPCLSTSALKRGLRYPITDDWLRIFRGTRDKWTSVPDSRDMKPFRAWRDW